MRPLPDLSIRQLEYLVAVAEEPTWAVAAERVGVSASALSQGLAELERRLGVALFDRDGRRRLVRPAASRWSLTPARCWVSPTTSPAGPTGFVPGRSGALRLGMIDAAAVVHCPDQLRTFRAGHPDVDLRLRVSPSAQLSSSSWQANSIWWCASNRPCRSPGSTPSRCSPKTSPSTGRPVDASAHPSTWGPWVLFPAGSHTRTVVVDELRRLGAPIDVVAESHQPEVLREMVRLGVGWTVLPTAQAEQGDRPLRRSRKLTTRRLVMATRTGSVRDPAVDELAAALAGAVSVGTRAARGSG